MICYSQALDLKFLLEGSGLFAEMRMNRDLNILSNGQILTMNDTQREFIKSMTNEDHVEKNVILTGPVGSGKTLLGLEAISIKKSHYKKKYGISSSDLKNKLRIIIVICYESWADEKSLLKQQIEMSSGLNDCSLDIHLKSPSQVDLTKIFRSDENYKSYDHTIIMMDEASR